MKGDRQTDMQTDRQTDRQVYNWSYSVQVWPARAAAAHVPTADPERQGHAEEDPAAEEEGAEGEMYRKVSGH